MTSFTDSLSGAPLGHPGDYPDHYTPSVLFTVSRVDARSELGLGHPLPFGGVDLWTAWELSWLDLRGKPVVAAAQLVVPANSPRIIESKSLKLYLGSFAQSAFGDPAQVRGTIAGDLSERAGAAVEVELVSRHRFDLLALRDWEGASIDGLAIDAERYQPDPGLLAIAPGSDPIDETLCSDLLRSNCPVTGQPDWGSIQVKYRGPRIDRASLLRYIVSYRLHCAFHEHCVERIWCDIKRACRPERLTVHARYLRRGGLDINPFRSDFEQRPGHWVRLSRQ